jgi:hypothetical protein
MLLAKLLDFLSMPCTMNLPAKTAVVGIRFMSFLRASVLALLLIGWIPVVNACALASAFPQIFSDCCSEPASPNKASDCNEGSCIRCASIETGLFATAAPLLPSAPIERQDQWLSRLLARLAANDNDSSRVIDQDTGPPSLPIWQIVARSGLPARAPSIA